MIDRPARAEAHAPGPRLPGPEGVAATLTAVLVVGLVVLSVIPPGAGRSVGPPGQSPAAASPTPGPSDPGVGVDLADVNLAFTIGTRLDADRSILLAELARREAFDATVAATDLRRVESDLLPLADAATRLARLPATRAPARDVGAFCTDLLESILTTLQSSPVVNRSLYMTAATKVADQLATLPALLNGLRGAALAASGGASPTPSGSSGARPSGTGPASAPPSASATATPGGSRSPSATPTGPNLLADPGFETGVGPPWQFQLGAGAVASISPDRTVVAGGGASARIDIADATDERAGVALVQSGIVLEAGGQYRVSITARAAQVREVRIRVGGQDGQTYAAAVFLVGPSFAPLTTDMTALVDDPDASLEIDLGRSTATTWLDDAAIVRLQPG